MGAVGQETVTVRGTAGLVIVMDVPTPGSAADERYQAALACGDLVIVDEPARATKASASQK